jgi:fibronectin type III domain protein
MNRRTPSKVAAVAFGLTMASTVVALDAGPAVAAPSTPAPPANLHIEDLAPDRMTVTWSPVAGATEYKVAVIPLEPAGGYARTDTDDPAVTLTRLTADIPYKVTVRAFVPSAYPNWYSETSTIVATTPLPDGYVSPGAPTNLRTERDSRGMTTVIRWDAPAQAFGPLTYRVNLESPDSSDLTGIFGHTSQLSFDADDLPLNTGFLAPGQTVAIWITATDRLNNASPPSQAIVLTCCPL